MTESSISRFDNIVDSSEVTNGDGVYFIKCNWQYNSFTIYLTDLTNVWSSNITSKYIDSVLKPQGMALEEFMNLLKKSLIQQDKSKKQFDYKINKSKKSSNDLEFCIVIILSELDSINIKSNIPLVRVNNNHQSFQNYFNWLFDKYKSLTDQNQQLVQLNQSLQSQFNQSIDQNKLFIKAKEKLESDLYEKFIMVLNEKKKKIKEYRQRVESLIVENSNIKKQQTTTCKCNNSNNNSSRGSGNNSGSGKQSTVTDQPNTPVKNTPKKKIKFTNNSYGSIFDDIMGDDNDYDGFRNTIEDIETNSNGSGGTSSSSSGSSSIYKSTFNNSTPSLDLLSNDDAYNIPTNIRKRFKPPSSINNCNNSSTDIEINSNSNKTTTTTTTTATSNFNKNNINNNNNSNNNNNNNKTPTKNRNNIPSNNSSPYKQQLQQQQQFTHSFQTSPIKKPKSNNNNYITQPITPIKAKSKSRIFVFDEEEDDQDEIHSNNSNNNNSSKITSTSSNSNINNRNKISNSTKGSNLNKSFNNDNIDDDLEPGASALLNEL